jgi:hypothetical protein
MGKLGALNTMLYKRIQKGIIRHGLNLLPTLIYVLFAGRNWMNQIERLIARVVQIVEDSPCAIVEIIVTVDGGGTPIAWVVRPVRAEGLQPSKAVLTSSQNPKSGL